MKRIKWSATASSFCGTIHRTRVNQDASRRYVTDGFACSVVSDGASSAAYAAEGSRLVVDTVRELATEWQSGLMELDDEALTARLAGAITRAVTAEAKKAGVNMGEFSATMAMIMCTPECYVAVNIGDGMIAAVTDGGVGARVLLSPESGRFANTCRFATDPDAAAGMRVVRGEFSLSETYVLMTDGPTFCLYNFTTHKLAPALGKFTEFLRHNDRHVAESAVRQAMIAKFTQYTSDDCTLMMLRGDEVDAPEAPGSDGEGMPE